MPKTRVLAGRVNSDVYDQVLEISSNNGISPNDFVKEAIENALNDHNKLAQPKQYDRATKVEKLEIVPPEEELFEELEKEGDLEEMFEEMFDDWREYARKKGYTLVKTKNLRGLLNFLKKKTKKEEEEEYECECGYKQVGKFNKCPRCGEHLKWPEES